MSCETLFLDQLRQHGFRLTPQRKIVLSVLHDLDGLATADAIYERVRAVNAAVDKSTVYRTLDLLHSFELVAVIDQGDDQRRYELLGLHGAHVHLVCQSCGAVVGVELEPLAAWITQMDQRYGFAIDARGITLAGLCHACQGQTNRLPGT
jgi:Fe2+ or Zn2+ uptake regulation protein